MSTDIYGGIEFRHAGVDTDSYDGEPWIAAMDLWPLYDESDYAAFGCLFGVRNYAKFRPLAADRGLPPDLSSGLRSQLQAGVEAGDLYGATWVSWRDLAALDPRTAPEQYAGRLSWSSTSSRSVSHQQLVPATWPSDLVAECGTPPPGLDTTARASEWTWGDRVCRYEPLTAGYLLGDSSQWPHVFAVMRALAGRFGDDAVRLVVAFD